MMRSTPMAALVLLALTAGLQGCASQRSEAALDEASATFQKVKDDSDVLRSAPRDVIRAGESLARAERLSSYIGTGTDVRHYAYLSQRYSEIAREHTNQALNANEISDLYMQSLQLSWDAYPAHNAGLDDLSMVKVDKFDIVPIKGVVIPRIHHKSFASDHGVRLQPRSNMWVGNNRCNFVADPLSNALV